MIDALTLRLDLSRKQAAEAYALAEAVLSQNWIDWIGLVFVNSAPYVSGRSAILAVARPRRGPRRDLSDEVNFPSMRSWEQLGNNSARTPQETEGQGRKQDESTR